MGCRHVVVASGEGHQLNREAEALYARINKEMGEATAVRGDTLKVAKRFPTGSLSLDVALGGGWPSNHWSEIVGHESHGKTAIVLKTVAACQAADPDFTTLWMAAEHYDVEQAEALGVDNSRVVVVASQAMEFVYQTLLDGAASKAFNLLVLDSYPALVPDEEEEKGMDESVMAIGARLTGKFFRKVADVMKRRDGEREVFGLFINQWRDAIGKFSPHGTPKTSPGGNAKNYAFYTRVEVRRGDWKEESRPGKGKVTVGQEIKAVTIKNKSAAPRQTAVFDFYFRDAPILGFRRGEYDEAKEIFTLGILYNLIQRRGAYFDMGDHNRDNNPLNGKDAAFRALREEVDLKESLRKEILACSQLPDHLLNQVSEEEMAAAADSGTKKVTRRKKT